MEKTLTKNLTEGNVFKCLVMFALPLFLGMLFQQFYNVFDTIIVGKVLGVDSLAGVGSTGSINFLILGFCNGVASGCAIPVAQSFGAKNYKNVRSYVANILYLGIVFVTLLTVVSCLLCSDILHWMGTLDNVFPYAYDYIFYIFLGIPVTFAYNVLSGIIRSLGDSKTPVIFLIIAIIINVALDLFFMVGLGKGVKYAAIATVLSQLLASLACLIFIIKKFTILKMEKDDWKLSWKKIGRLLWMGLPMGLQYSITAIGSIVLTGAVNSLNQTAYVAAVATSSKITCFFCTPFDALGGTMATYGGQNVGAGKYERLNEGLFKSFVIGTIYSFIALTVLYFFGREMSTIFLDHYDETIMNCTWQLLVINALFYIPLLCVNIFRFLIQGMGFSSIAIIAGVLEMVGRALIATIFVPKFGFIAICFASPLAWVLADAFLIPTYFVSRKKLMRKKKVS